MTLTTPKPKVPGSAHFGKGEKLQICETLVKFGICEWIKESEVVQVKGDSQSIAPGFVWPGEKEVLCFPTCTRAVWKDYPPSKPAGIHRADADCRAGWASAGYIYTRRINFEMSSFYGGVNNRALPIAESGSF